MYYKGKWCTAGGKGPLFGHVDGFQIGPNQSFLCPLTHGVQAGGVAVDIVEIGQHGVDGRAAHGRCCRVVSINLHNS